MAGYKVFTDAELDAFKAQPKCKRNGPQKVPSNKSNAADNDEPVISVSINEQAKEDVYPCSAALS
jgi:hypothetical protein